MKLNYLHFLAIAAVLLNYLSVYETKSVCQNSHYGSSFRIKRAGPPSFDLSKLQKPTTSLGTTVVKVPITNKSNAAKLARIAKKAEAAVQKAQIPEDLMLDKTEKFKEKHLFQHDISEGNVDSFTELTSDPYFAKKYLVERNRNLINGDVLPQWDDKNVKRWFKDAGKTKITIVDAPLETLQQDIEPAFQEWKKTLPEDANNKKIFPAKASDFETLKTTGEYDMTEISYETFDEGDGKLGVYVNFKKLHGKLELGTNDLGQITHFEKPLVSELATGFGDKGEVSGGVDIGVVQEKNHFVKFTSAELDQNRQLTNDFWTKLKATNNKKKLNSVLNPNAEGYKEFVSENDIELERSVLNPPKKEEILTNIEDADDGVNTGGDTSDGVGKRRGTSGIRERSPICTPGERRRKRRRRAAYAAGLSPCAIFLKPNGDVETILPDEFVDEYTKADAKMKKELTDSAKDNMDKLDLDDDIDGDHDDYGGAYKKVAKLVQLEDMKSHVEGVEAVTSFQSDDYDYSQNQPTKGRIRQSIGDVVDTVSGKLSGIKSKVKMSMTKTGHALREGITEFGESIKSSVGTMKAVVSTAFMAKTIIKGILKGDALSLSIVGTQIGFQTAVWAGQKFFSAASKVSKASKFLSKWAGPVGAMIDIGFNMYSIGKSIERLNKATNKWDRNDAIIDIVSTSVDMYVNYAVFVISTAFPPIAPIMDLINIIVDILNKIITGIFKAWNEVDRIDSEIGLLDFEKDEVFNSRIMDWFGQRKKDYLEYLVEEKKANDMAVEHNKKSLENNSFLLGIAFPSRTLAYEGGCRLTKQHCAFDLFGCWVWEELVEVGRGCDHHRQCGPRLCMTKYEYIESSSDGYDFYNCKCDKEAETSFGYARQNSVVDFTTKRNLYWERAVPKEVDGAEFKCKPGALNFLDYKLHKMTSRWDYWCKDAIAILQPQNKRKEGQVMLFDLQDGHDQVFAGSDNTPNLFRMGNEGLKEFYGSNGRNEFLFDGNCSSSLKGNLTGGASDTDAITIMSSCAEGQYVHVNFTSGVLVSQDTMLNMRFGNVEQVRGRKGEGDVVTVDCDTKQVVLEGGNKDQFDHIHVPNRCEKYNMTVIAYNFTIINSKASGGDIMIWIDNPWNSLNIYVDIHPKNLLKVSILFISTSMTQATFQSPEVSGPNITLTLRKEEGESGDVMKISLRFINIPDPEDQAQGIHFSEGPSNLSLPHTILMLSVTRAPVFIHTLPKLNSATKLTRIGHLTLSNVFNINGPNWHVVGGNEEDTFILNSPTFGSIDGGEGDAEDKLVLHQNLRQTVVLNLTDKKQIKNIEIVNGAPGNPFQVICACETKMVTAPGGSRSMPDVIIIPEMQVCSQRQLQIVAEGYSKVVIEGEIGNAENQDDSVTVLAISSDQYASDSDALQFELNTLTSNSTGGLVVSLQLTHKNWTAFHGIRAEDGMSVSTMIRGQGKEYIKLVVPDSPEEAEETFLSIPFIQVSNHNSDEFSPILVIERHNLIAKLLYKLTNETKLTNESRFIEGFGIPNLFQVISDSWSLKGGSSNDVFTISPSAQREVISVDGGDGVQDILNLETELDSNGISETYGVNLETEEMGYLSASVKGSIQNIEVVTGRSAQPDFIHVNCNTKTVDGREGAGEGKEDLIFISGKGCDQSNFPEMTIYAKKFTKVRNSAVNGFFTYHIPDPFTTNIELNALESNFHRLQFNFHPWEYVRAIGLDENHDTLGIKMENGDQEVVLVFSMYRKNESEDYSNPGFSFNQPGSQVMSSLLVGKDGVIATTLMLQGNGLRPNETVEGLPVHVNRFLINVTTTSSVEVNYSEASGGGSVRGGGQSAINQFWLFQLKNGLDLLDGGDCPGGSCTNYLDLARSFESETPVEINLGVRNGSIEADGRTIIKKLVNIHQLQGRSGESSHDKVTVSSCHIRQLTEVEEIVIEHVKGNDCIYNLSIQIDNRTLVRFGNWGEGEYPTDLTNWVSSSFNYYFLQPTSFDLEGGDELAYFGPSHNYYFSFPFGEIESIWFDEDAEQLHYFIDGEDYNHSMIMGPGNEHQFYLQPAMMTSDKFLIQVFRDGGILFTLKLDSNVPSDVLRSEIIPGMEESASKLGSTILIQTPTQFLFVGYSSSDDEDDRNVLQNVAFSESHLIGAGAKNAMYEIVSLDNNVWIYTGLENETEFQPENIQNETKQTLDLTDVIVPLRIRTKTKYVPTMEVISDDFVISMEGYENEHPGKIWIVNGAKKQVATRVQLLLNSAIMDFLPIHSEGEGQGKIFKRSAEILMATDKESNDSSTERDGAKWEIRPRPIIISDSTIFTIAKEDLEDNHEIRMAGNNSESLTNFQAARKGMNLYLTNVVNSSSSSFSENETLPDIATLVIIDYYKDFAKKDEEDDRSTKGDDRILPDLVLGVTISLPGLNFMLNDSKILPLSTKTDADLDYDEEVGDGGSIRKGSNLDPIQIQEWDFILHVAEETILEDMPDIPRVFKYEKTINYDALLRFIFISFVIFLTIMAFVMSNIIEILFVLQRWDHNNFFGSSTLSISHAARRAELQKKSRF